MNTWHGFTDFSKSLKLQEAELARLLALEAPFGDRPQSVFGFEHPAVITLGRRALEQSEILKQGLIPVVQTDRGGLATIHSPGQLVISPLLSTDNFGFSLKKTLDFLLTVSEKTFIDLGIKTNRLGFAGLATPKGKLMFVGLRVRKSYLMHGLSFNISNDLSLFNLIQVCGASGSAAAVDSVRSHGVEISTQAFFELWLNNFRSGL